MTQLWCNGQWIDALDFAMAPTDRGLTLGLGLFETILAMDGVPVFAELHVERLRAGCERLGWSPDIPDLEYIMIELVRINELATGRARIRLAISGGSGRFQDLALGNDHLIWMTAFPVAEPPAFTTANLSPWPRNEQSPLVGLKSASYAENLIALERANRLGFEETIFVNTGGHLCEAATSNLFLVRDGVLSTPSLDCGCLPGITRSAVIRLANEASIACEERAILPDELLLADEIFLTSAIRGVMGLSRFEDRTLLPGPVTHLLRNAWTAASQRKTAKSADVFH